MKTQNNITKDVCGTFIRRCRERFAGLAAISTLVALAPSLQAAPHHDVSAANFSVIQNDTGNTTASQTVTTPLSINDMQVRDGSIRGVYNVQIGADPLDDTANGILIGSIRQNGRDNGETSANRKGTNYGFATTGITNILDPSDPYVLVAFADSTTFTNGARAARYNFDVAGAWFPYSSWVGGHVYIASGANGAYGNAVVNDTLRGTAGLSYANNVTEPSSGNYVLNLTSLGIDSRTDGVLLVTGGKNENNWANSDVNQEDGTWNIQVKDANDNGAGTEEDPFAFVFIPRTNTAVISGSFLGDGTIGIFSGASPQFTISSNGVGTYELKIPGFKPTNGVLIVSPQGGGTKGDNMVTYEANAANNGWIIQSRDFPAIGAPLEAVPADETVASFVFIPADNDLPNLVITPSTVNVVEGKTSSFAVSLKTQPTSDVTVTVSSSNTAQGGTVSPSVLTFTTGNWNVPQSVSVLGANDLNSDGDTKFQITNSVTSADADYGTLDPSVVPATTLDDEPHITLSGGAIYRIGSPGKGVDGEAILSDENTTNYNGTTLVVTITANGTADDRLEIRNTGTGPGQIGVAGNTVSYEGTAIATFTGGTGTTPLSVTFNSNANSTNAQVLLQAVTFRNVSATPSTNPRSVSVVVTHPDGGSGSAATVIRVGVLGVSVFQQNVDSGFGVYTNAADCEIQKNEPFTPFPTGRNSISGLFSDFPEPGGNGSQVLMRFDNLFGNGLGQIPNDAIIVSADLSINLLDSGDGSPLYRMLIPFDAANATWDSFGGGVDTDDVEARSTFDSVFGLTAATLGTNNSPNTGVGKLTFSVLSDVLAWQSGQPNFGWVLPGSDYQFDGLGISPGESSNPDVRPRLRITWVPAGTAVATFRQGVNGYTGAQDTSIRAVEPDTDRSTNTALFVDWAVTGPTENDEQILIKFDNIIGTGAGQIPPNSIVHAAVLDVNSSDLGNAMGDGGTFHSMLIPWDQTNTWNTIGGGGGIAADDIKAVAATSATAGNSTLNPNIEAAFHTFDLTSDVQAWASGARPNYGWVILPWPNGGDGWAFDASDALNEIQRPQLRVYYTPGAPSITIQSISRTATSVTIKFGGEVGATYSVRRAGTVDGTYNIVGNATVQQDGTATFVDNAPPTGAGFYRISNP